MGTGRTLHKKPRTRPIKAEGERIRREKTQRKRLVALGADAAEVGKMNAKQVRDALKRPAKVAASASR
ncbi:MAG: hypothetical protein ACOX5G_06295 [Kiritimatiellia bacterium]|jgi:hypothetical protein